jgi:hypothetical protein
MTETNIRTEAARVEDVRRPRGSVKEPIAEVGPDWERPVGSDPRDPVPVGDPAKYATEPTLVPLDGVPTSGGSRSFTFVAEGDRLPSPETTVPADASAAYRAKVHKPNG